jgi:hypothetical protein
VGLSAAAGIAGHAILTNVRKHHEIKNEPEPEIETPKVK